MDYMTTFDEWLKETHPEVRLLPIQQEWVDGQEGKRPPFMLMGGIASGKTFIFNLYKEYREGKQ